MYTHTQEPKQYNLAEAQAYANEQGRATQFFIRYYLWGQFYTLIASNYAADPRYKKLAQTVTLSSTIN